MTDIFRVGNELQLLILNVFMMTKVLFLKLDFVLSECFFGFYTNVVNGVLMTLIQSKLIERPDFKSHKTPTPAYVQCNEAAI